MLASNEEAEDALQHTFMAAYRALRSSERPILLKAWLYTIARNRCLSILRARREQVAFDDGHAASDGLAADIDRRAELRGLLADLEQLPEEQRAALVLFELGDHSHDEIAEVLGVRRDKVKALVFQARESLAGWRRARETPCIEIREQLATARGAAFKRAALRRHVARCEGCAEFETEVRRQRSAMALLLPAVPTAGLKAAILGAAGISASAGAGAGGGSLAGLPAPRRAWRPRPCCAPRWPGAPGARATSRCTRCRCTTHAGTCPPPRRTAPTAPARARARAARAGRASAEADRHDRGGCRRRCDGGRGGRSIACGGRRSRAARQGPPSPRRIRRRRAAPSGRADGHGRRGDSQRARRARWRPGRAASRRARHRRARQLRPARPLSPGARDSPPQRLRPARRVRSAAAPPSAGGSANAAAPPSAAAPPPAAARARGTDRSALRGRHRGRARAERAARLPGAATSRSAGRARRAPRRGTGLGRRRPCAR